MSNFLETKGWVVLLVIGVAILAGAVGFFVLPRLVDGNEPAAVVVVPSQEPSATADNSLDVVVVTDAEPMVQPSNTPQPPSVTPTHTWTATNTITPVPPTATATATVLPPTQTPTLVPPVTVVVTEEATDSAEQAFIQSFGVAPTSPSADNIVMGLAAQSAIECTISTSSVVYARPVPDANLEFESDELYPILPSTDYTVTELVIGQFYEREARYFVIDTQAEAMPQAYVWYGDVEPSTDCEQLDVMESGFTAQGTDNVIVVPTIAPDINVIRLEERAWSEESILLNDSFVSVSEAPWPLDRSGARLSQWGGFESGFVDQYLMSFQNFGPVYHGNIVQVPVLPGYILFASGGATELYVDGALRAVSVEGATVIAIYNNTTNPVMVSPQPIQTNTYVTLAEVRPALQTNPTEAVNAVFAGASYYIGQLLHDNPDNETVGFYVAPVSANQDQIMEGIYKVIDGQDYISTAIVNGNNDATDEIYLANQWPTDNMPRFVQTFTELMPFEELDRTSVFTTIPEDFGCEQLDEEVIYQIACSTDPDGQYNDVDGTYELVPGASLGWFSTNMVCTASDGFVVSPSGNPDLGFISNASDQPLRLECEGDGGYVATYFPANGPLDPARLALEVFHLTAISLDPGYLIGAIEEQDLIPDAPTPQATSVAPCDSAQGCAFASIQAWVYLAPAEWAIAYHGEFSEGTGWMPTAYNR